MKAEIVGENLPVLICKLDQGESVFTEVGGMTWMDESIEMTTNTNGGVMKGLGRALSGESIFMNIYTSKKDNSEIAFASSFPGKIIEFDVSQGNIICQKRAFLCAEKSVDMKMKFKKKFGAGLFGGEGFIMQELSGTGRAYIEIDGSVVKKEIKPGQTLKIDNGYVAAMTEGVTLDITTVKGLKNIVFGGEGLFLTTVKGEGSVWIQTMPLAKLAANLSPYIVTNTSKAGTVLDILGS